MARPEKAAVVEDIKEKLRSAGSVFLTDFTGLNVQEMGNLRRELRKNEIVYTIAKNTLIRRAFNESEMAELEEFLVGPTAVAFGADDASVPAKIFYESFKKLEKPVTKCFYIDGKLFSEYEDLEAFASLPSKEELLVQVLVGIESPLTGLIASIEAPARELVSVLEALVEAKK